MKVYQGETDEISYIITTNLLIAIKIQDKSPYLFYIHNIYNEKVAKSEFMSAYVLV